ncbi:hypothetical protein PGTUg99_023232 [Puccinia graminis f. sp. tritici]|uniref:Uncharacterized protein n=1 Tax=Puccinia graminis f. sp. tritici TaxID=56615 RepID=A0A5B0Q8T4_PUCGR|nr:hypothetical protein PGTUg99_023232 [Puccinia graminis f. sp. tritici]
MSRPFFHSSSPPTEHLVLPDPDPKPIHTPSQTAKRKGILSGLYGQTFWQPVDKRS